MPPAGEATAPVSVGDEALSTEATRLDSSADFTDWLAGKVHVAVPPVFALVALSPLLVIEVVARTTFNSGVAVLPPTVLVAFTLLVMVWWDRRRDSTQGVPDIEPFNGPAGV